MVRCYYETGPLLNRAVAEKNLLVMQINIEVGLDANDKQHVVDEADHDTTLEELRGPARVERIGQHPGIREQNVNDNNG